MFSLVCEKYVLLISRIHPLSLHLHVTSLTMLILEASKTKSTLSHQ